MQFIRKTFVDDEVEDGSFSAFYAGSIAGIWNYPAPPPLPPPAEPETAPVPVETVVVNVVFMEFTAPVMAAGLKVMPGIRINQVIWFSSNFNEDVNV